MEKVKGTKAMPNMFSAPVWTCPERQFWPTTKAWTFAASLSAMRKSCLALYKNGLLHDMSGFVTFKSCRLLNEPSS